MGEFFRSALNYISQAGAGGQCAFGGQTDHHLVGSTVKIADNIFKIRSLLAEGGYALVFSVQDLQGNWFALKRQLATDKNSAEAIIQEIKFMREVCLSLKFLFLKIKKNFSIYNFNKKLDFLKNIFCIKF